MAGRLSNPESPPCAREKTASSCCVGRLVCAYPPGQVGSLVSFKLSISLLVLCPVCLSITEKGGWMSAAIIFELSFSLLDAANFGPCC